MKKKEMSIYKELPLAKLYYEDLRSIYEILNNECEEILIEVNEYQLDDFEEIKDIYEPIYSLNFTTIKPEIRVNMNKQISIYTLDNSFRTKGIIQEIDNIVCNRKIFLGEDISNKQFFGWFFLPIIIIMILVQANIILSPNKELTISILWLILVSLPFLFILLYNRKSRYFNTIKKDLPNFWIRNRDSIILLCIGTFLGWLLSKFL